MAFGRGSCLLALGLSRAILLREWNRPVLGAATPDSHRRRRAMLGSWRSRSLSHCGDQGAIRWPSRRHPGGSRERADASYLRPICVLFVP